MKNLISWLLRITVALIFLQTLYFKFTAHPDSVFIFMSLGVEPWGRIFTGVLELITAILILIPKTQLFGMISSLAIISGAILSHFFVLGFDVAMDGGDLFYLAIIIFVFTISYLLLYKKDFVLLAKKCFLNLLYIFKTSSILHEI